MRWRDTLLVLLLVALAPTVAAAAGGARLDSPVGFWQPLDNTGKPLGLIRIFEAHGLYYGRIEPSFPGDDRGERCTRCTDDRHNQPLSGLLLIRHLRWQDGKYVGGDILDPNTGRVYDCTLQLTDGGHQLIMRGFLGLALLGRSQTWQRVEHAATR